MLAKSIRRAFVRLGTPLAIALMLPLTALPALAEGLTFHFSSEHHGDRHHFGREHHTPGQGHSHSRHRHSRTHLKHGHATQRQHEHDRRGRYTSHECRTVIKKAYEHGRLAKIAGKLCYDRHGNPYIVKGSRYVVRYYE